MEHRRRESSVSSSGSLESSEINDDFSTPDTKTPLTSGRTNANLWRDTVEEQSLEEQMRSGPNLVGGELTKRGTETYELPAFDEMDQDELVKAQQFVNEDLKRVVHSHKNDLFDPTDDVPNEYGTEAKRFKKRTVLSDRIPIASKDAERLRQESDGAFRRPRYDASNSDAGSVKSSRNGFNKFGSKAAAFGKTSIFDGAKKPAASNFANTNNSSRYASTTSLASSSDKSSFKSKRKNRKRVANGTVKKEDLPIPVHLLAESFSAEKFYSTTFNQSDTSDLDQLGRKMAEALGEQCPEMIIFAVNTIGGTAAIRIFERTQKFEQAGGMSVNNQTRRRTPGGVFLKLLRSDKFIDPAIRDAVRNYGDKLRQIAIDNEKKVNAALPSLPTAAEVHRPVIDAAMETGP
uniref:Phosphorylated adapter RNA export protein n=1 Tax=Panagrellus redivivus TaxID=6233 RepID=A0A7E4VKQ7_PANRE